VEEQIEQAEPLPPVQPNAFKTSHLPQSEDLKKFLTEKLANPYNKYCLDCKKNTTTHCIIWLGIFLCKDCAEMHKTTFGGN